MNRFITILIIFTVALGIYSCSGLKNVRVDERYGKRIAYVQEGVGTPAIILESGFDSGMETWGDLIDTLAQYSMVYTYNRPGYGKSNQKDAPHSIREIAEQLHANLLIRNVPPPYVLVGYSDGALMVNMFARLYPQEIAGVLMLEPVHPDLYNYLEENEAVLYELLFDQIGKGQRLYEFDLIKNVSEEFKKAPPFPNVPLTILMAGRHSTLESEALKEKIRVYHEELKNLSPKGKRYLLDGSGHWIHRNNPAAVKKYVYQMLID